MNVFTKRLLASLVICTVSAPVLAADTTIIINGKVVAAACTVDNSGSYTITMPDVTAATLSTAGTAGADKDFSVTLSACPTGTTNVVAKFSGTAADSDKYANTTGTGYATNVVVQLRDQATDTNKGNGSTMSVPVDSSRNATFALKARPYSPTGGATVGDINTVVLMDFTYN